MRLQFAIKLPTFNHHVTKQRTTRLLYRAIPSLITGALLCRTLSKSGLRQRNSYTRSTITLQSRLTRQKLITFITRKTVLPQHDKISSHPLLRRTIPFRSPSSLEIALAYPRTNPMAKVNVPRNVALVINNNCRKGSALLQTLRQKICGRVPKSKQRRIIALPATVGIQTRSNHDMTKISVSPFVNDLPRNGSAHRFSAPGTDNDASRTTGVVRTLRTKTRILLISRSASTAGFVVHSHQVRTLVTGSHRPVAPFVSGIHRLCASCNVSAILIVKNDNSCFSITSAIVTVSRFYPRSIATRTRTVTHRCRATQTDRKKRRFNIVAPHVPLPRDVSPDGNGHDIELQSHSISRLRVNTRTVSLSTIRRLIRPKRIQTVTTTVLCTRQRCLSRGASLTTTITTIVTSLSRRNLSDLAS